MGSKSEAFKTIVIDDCWAVVRTDTSQPRHLEVIATFYDEARARDYAHAVRGGSHEEMGEAHTQEAEAPAPKREPAKTNGAETDLSQRQSAVLNALRDKMDDNRLVAVKAAVLADAAQIPLGSLHSVLGSLEKKHLIVTTRPGSARAPAVYQVR